MNIKRKISLFLILFSVGFGSIFVTGLHASDSLISNGDFERNGTSGPADWSGPGGSLSYEKDGGNTYARLTSLEPGKTAMLYRVVDIPAGVQALKLSWRWRTTNLKPGSKAWYDARIMMNFKNASGGKASTSPPHPYLRKSTNEWQEKSVVFLVPEDAVALEYMPSLFQVKQGVMDLDDIRLEPVDPTAVRAKADAKAAEKARLTVAVEAPKTNQWPPMLKVVGNRLHNPEGKEVWLQGVNVASLEWSARGENVLKSTEVAIDKWGANVIRLPVKDSYWFDDDGESYRKLVDNVITLAANRGAYVVLDLHRYRAPKDEYLTFWKDAATRYSNHPAVLFDLINEPHGITWDVWLNGGFVAEKGKKADEDAFLTADEKVKNAQGFESPGMQAMVDTVRATGAKNIVVIGGLDWAYDLSGILDGYAVKDDPQANGVMYSTHVYPWKKGWVNKFLKVADKYPIFVGEVGADINKMEWMAASAQEDAETWVPAMLAVIQDYRLNWTAWCFHPRASPRLLLDWNYTPTPFWGEQVIEAFSGKKFKSQKMR
ncbi:glycoside hydrolase family 5 protein [Cerasicoccus arenae]|uniref:Glycoside hydrolase family 5 domain-containing protein n=1 Tax=Cerasicoccus arenae TaxID=424488 RepID=A0A8J3GCV2_9BACT|nr:glycoside hydrolase family 5 protein [Cerasicoccus arenae]MBK1859822.1 cellulase family glycosylhydrolase [Cerasicoccus arenae]GHC01525.1 hypothetical protein GCM10007047_17540 [Cerasicoccus arenae]